MKKIETAMLVLVGKGKSYKVSYEGRNSGCCWCANEHVGLYYIGEGDDFEMETGFQFLCKKCLTSKELQKKLKYNLLYP
jgi:hypothetical protein